VPWKPHKRSDGSRKKIGRVPEARPVPPPLGMALQRLISRLRDDDGTLHHMDEASLRKELNPLAGAALGEAKHAGCLEVLQPAIETALSTFELKKDAWDAPPVIGRPKGLPSWPAAIARHNAALETLERLALLVRQTPSPDSGGEMRNAGTSDRDSFPTLRPIDAKILRALEDAGTTLTQFDMSDRVSFSERSIRDVLRQLREAGLTHRPHGERGGETITERGRAALRRLPPS
jgi:hypothetical protein